MDRIAKAEYDRKWNAANKDRRRGYIQKWRDEHPGYDLNLRIKNAKNHLVSSAKSRAKDKVLPFDITVNDFDIPKVCPILGIEMKRGGGQKAPTLDRIIPNLGYVKGNIQVISRLANVMKNEATFDQMIKLGKWAEKMNAPTGSQEHIQRTNVHDRLGRRGELPSGNREEGSCGVM